jgi:hypothetical protein
MGWNNYYVDGTILTDWGSACHEKSPPKRAWVRKAGDHQFESSLLEDEEDEDELSDELPESQEVELSVEDDEEEDEPESQDEDELSADPPPKSKLDESRAGAAGALYVGSA